MKKNKIIEKVKGVLIFAVLSTSTFASGTGGMVWEKSATSISKSISGPVAGLVALVAVIVAACAWAFTDGGNMMGKCIKVVAALSLIGGAGVFLSSVFGISTAGGMLI